MTESLPLYDSLIKDCKSKPLSVKQKKYILTSIESLNDQKKELVYILINHHSIIKKNGDIFQCLKDDNGDETYNLTWDLDVLPNMLGQIILKFLEKDELVDKERNEEYPGAI